MKFDGPLPKLLTQHAPRGTANVQLAHVSISSGTNVSSKGSRTRMSFNLNSASGTMARWKGSGRGLDYLVEPGGICIAPPALDVEGSNGAAVEFLAMSVPSDLVNVAAGEMNIAGGDIMERVGMQDPRLLRLALAMRSELESGLPGGVMRWTELSAILAVQLAKRHMSKSAESRSPTMSSRTIKRVNDFMMESLDEPITLDDLAMAAGLSRFHFLRAFANTVGMTPSRYLMHRRVQAAMAMARFGNESFAAIAYATGFADHSHLSRWFRRVYGVRLSEVRDR